MAIFKSSCFLAFLSFGMVAIQPSMGQQTTLSTLDFWLTFAELLTGDALTELSKVELPNLVPNIALPNIPNIVLPNIVFPDIDLSGLSAPHVAPPAVPAAPAPMAPAPARQPYYVYMPPTPAPVAPAISFPTFPTTTAAPTTTHRPDCQPEKVRIIVVNDCDKKKPQESSESSESSEEAQIIVPYQKRGRPHFQRSSKY
jgi:hypothetical protein